MLHRLPHIRPGQTVGLLGGSFDPPHRGHVAISHAALRRFGLDHLFWLVSPGNPLKAHAPAPLTCRIAVSRDMLTHPRIHVSDIEAHLNTRYTAETLRKLRHVHPGVDFVWLMGADNLKHFHLWRDWQEILNTVSVGVLARPGDQISARLSPAARMFRHTRLTGRQSQALARRGGAAWCFVNVPMVDLSSSEIRARGGWATERGQAAQIQENTKE